jgi:hypothetical protein
MQPILDWLLSCDVMGSTCESRSQKGPLKADVVVAWSKIGGISGA